MSESNLVPPDRSLLRTGSYLTAQGRGTSASLGRGGRKKEEAGSDWGDIFKSHGSRGRKSPQIEVCDDSQSSFFAKEGEEDSCGSPETSVPLQSFIVSKA